MNEKLLGKELTGRIIGAFDAVYNVFGFGFLENVYKGALALELTRRGMLVQREVPVQVYYLGQPVAIYKVDMLIDRTVVIEVKSTKTIAVADKRQLLNYLCATQLEIALLLHFGPEPAYHRLISTNKKFKLDP